MKIKRTLKKGICYVATFAMVLAMSLGMGTIDAKAGGARTISINGYALTVSEYSPTAYYLNGGSAGSESNYNAKLEYDAEESILTLNGLDITLDTSIPEGVDANGIVFAAYIEINVVAGEQSTTSTSTEDDSVSDATVTTENKTDNTDGSVTQVTAFL